MAADRSRLWLVGLAAIAACGGDDEPPPEDPNIPLEALCTELAEADCARLSACGSLRAPLDEATCVAWQASVLCGSVQAALTLAVDAGALDYFELAARDCRAAIEGLGCEVGFEHDLLAPAACAAMVSARGEEGDPCHLAFVCQEGLHCNNEAACPGTCAPLLTNNQPCGFGERCDDATYCDVTAMRCLARTDLGGTCGLALSGNSCLDGAFCDRSNPAAPVCARGRGRNEGCQSDAECAQGRCIQNRCSEGLEGDACRQAFHCWPALDCVSGSCRAPGGLDDTCTATGVFCGPALTCTSTMGQTRCRPHLPIGAACSDETPDCLLGRCIAGRCEAALDDGTPCTDPASCLPGRTCDGGRCTAIPRDCRYSTSM